MEILKVQSTEDKLNYLLQTKAAIKQAIIDQGGTITENTTFREFVEQIQELNVIEPEVIEEIKQALRELAEIEEEQNEQIQTIVAALNTKLEEADVADLRTQADSNTTRITTAEEEVTSLKGRATSLEERTTNLETNKANQSDLDSTNTRVQLAEAAIQANTGDINAVKTRVQTAEENISTNTTNIAKNTSDISDINENIEEIQTTVESNTNAIVANKEEFDQAVIDLNEEISKRLTTEAAKPLIKKVEYNATTATFTFEDMEGNIKTVDLPLEATVKGGRYDAARKVLILILVSDDEIEIPVTDLVDVYTGLENAKIKVIVNNQNQIEAQLKSASVEKTDLATALVEELEAKAEKTYVDELDEFARESITTLSANLETITGDVIVDSGRIDVNEREINKLKTKMTTAEGNITTNTTNIANNTQAISDLETAVDGKLTMKELGDDLLEAAKATSAGTLVPKIFADLQFSHKYRLMLPYITINNTGAVSYGFQDLLSNSVNDKDTNPVTLEFVKDENDDDVYIKLAIDQSKLTEVGKVDTVNNIQPDSNKNITLDATQINVDETAETKITMKEAIENIKQPLVIDATNIIFLSENSTSEEIFNAFGGKEVIEDIVKNAYIGNTILGRTYGEWGPPSAFGLDLINIDVSLNYDPYGKFDLDTYPSISIYMSFELDGTRYRIELYFYRNDSNIVVGHFEKYISEKVVYLSTSIAGLDKDKSTQSEINDALRVSTGDIKTTNYNYKSITFKFGYYDGSTWLSPFYTTGNTNKPVLLDAQIIRDTPDNLYNYKIIVKFIDIDNNILKKLVFTRSDEESDFVISSQEELDLSQITTNKTAIETLDNKIDGVEDRLQEEIDNIEVPEYSVVEATTTTGYAKTYSLTKDGVEVGAKINIPKDLVVKSGEVKVVTVADQPYEGAVVGDKYIDLEINDSSADHIYIPVKDLVDVYTGKNNTKIHTIINANNEIEATLQSGTVEKTDLTTTLQNEIDGKVNKSIFTDEVTSEVSESGLKKRGIVTDSYFGVGIPGKKVNIYLVGVNPYSPNNYLDIIGKTSSISTDPDQGLNVYATNSKEISFSINSENLAFNHSSSGLSSTKIPSAIRELKGLVDTNTSDISDLQDAIEEAGKVDTVNNIQPDSNKNITLDATQINVDETAATKVTIKSNLEDLATQIWNEHEAQDQINQYVHEDIDGLGERISTEETTRENADQELQNQIDSIHIPDVPEYTIEEQAQAETGYSKTYYLTKDGTQVGSKINIPKDLVIKSGEVKTVTVADVPYEGAVVGDKYIDITLNDQTEDHIYIPVKDLVDVYTGVDGNKITVSINGNNQIEALIKTGTIEETDLTTALQTKIGNIATNTQNISGLDTRLTAAETDIDNLEAAIEEAGKVDMVNNIQPDANKNIQLDASNINLDDTAETPETLKAIIEAQATKITTLEGKVAELEAALGDIRTALELLNGVEDANNEEF